MKGGKKAWAVSLGSFLRQRYWKKMVRDGVQWTVFSDQNFRGQYSEVWIEKLNARGKKTDVRLPMIS